MLQVCGMDPNTDTHKVVENGDGTSEETVPDQPAPDLSILLKKLEDQNRYHSCTRSHLSGPCPRFYLTAIEEYLEEEVWKMRLNVYPIGYLHVLMFTITTVMFIVSSIINKGLLCYF